MTDFIMDDSGQRAADCLVDACMHAEVIDQAGNA